MPSADLLAVLGCRFAAAMFSLAIVRRVISFQHVVSKIEGEMRW